jgi:hypothetical protein
MPAFGLMFILEILCAVHVVRTGRPYFWIYLIVFVPGIGMIVYVVAEILPEFMGSPRARAAAGQMAKSLNPGRELREAERRLAMTETAENQATLAEAYLAVGRNDEALELYRRALTGIHASDPAMLFGLARTQFARGEYHAAQRALERAREANPNGMSPESCLLYARSLEAQGSTAPALEEYAALAPTYPGQEARYHYAMLLRQSGLESEARKLFEEICQAAEFAPRHTRRLQGQWYTLARQQLAG